MLNRVNQFQLIIFISVLLMFIASAHAEKTGDKQWPFTKWAYAKAYTFNFTDINPEYQNRILKDGKWSKHIRGEKMIDREQALEFANLAHITKGSFETSKCFFARHAIVFFNDLNKPVGTIDICFECEGQRVWPDYDIAPEERYGRDEAQNELAIGKFLKQLELYKTRFRELGMPTDYKAR